MIIANPAISTPGNSSSSLNPQVVVGNGEPKPLGRAINVPGGESFGVRLPQGTTLDQWQVASVTGPDGCDASNLLRELGSEAISNPDSIGLMGGSHLEQFNFRAQPGSSQGGPYTLTFEFKSPMANSTAARTITVRVNVGADKCPARQPESKPRQASPFVSQPMPGLPILNGGHPMPTAPILNGGAPRLPPMNPWWNQTQQ